MDFKTKIEKQDTEEIVNSKYINWEHFKNSTILVTGATGMIGSQIVKSILYANEIKGVNINIVALVRNKKKAEKLYGFNNIKYIVQNIEKPVKPNFSPDYIIHTANSTSSKEFTEKPVETLNSIITGTKNILEFARKSSIKGILYLSSMEVYGYTDFDRSEPLKETDYGYIDILNSRNSYPVGKQLAESMCFAYAKEYGVPVKIARLCQTIGSGVDFNDNRVFAQFARNVVKKEDIVLKTTGETTRSYCYITDAVSAIFSLLERGQNGEAYNIANSDATCSIKEMAEMLTEKYTDLQLKIAPQDNKEYLGKIKLVLDTTKIQSLNWSAKINLEEMFDRLIRNFEMQSSMIRKIIVFGFLEDNNIGDPVICEVCKFLIDKICKEQNINAISELHALFPPPDWRAYRITRFLRRRTRKDRGSLGGLYTYLGFKFYNFVTSVMRKYYKNILKNADMVIFAGGGMLKYISQDFWAADYMIVNYCEKHNIPVYFNAVGIEGYDEKHFLSRVLKKIMNKKCVKGITTRDDVVSLEKYINKPCEDLVVGDPVLWADSVYKRAEPTDLIGINTIRSGIFNVNGKDIQEEDLINFYYEMIKRLNSKGYKWQLYTNGTNLDYEMGLKVLNKLNIEPSEENIAPLPKNSLELIDLITKYKGIIGSRMHTHIIAASYRIPTVGLIWNDKIRWFAKHLQASNRFFEYTEMNKYDEIFAIFENALQEKFENQEEKIAKLKSNTYNKLSDFILNQSICKQEEKLYDI